MAGETKSWVWRVTLGPLLILAVLGCFWLDHTEGTTRHLRALVLLAMMIGVREFAGLCRRRGHEIARSAVLIFCAVEGVGQGGAPPGIPDAALFVIHHGWFLFVAYVLLKLVIRHPSFSVEAAGLSLLGGVYVSMLARMFDPPRCIGLTPDPVLLFVLFLLVCAKTSDIIAYAFGKAVGRHKMTPVISPNKTWEGTIAGALAGTAAGYALILCTPLETAFDGVPAPLLILLSFFVTMASQFGDLVESAFKRWAGAKDSGRFLPGFGGMLDLTDSFHVSIPVAYVLIEGLCRRAQGGA